jgi:hypothetical protein
MLAFISALDSDECQHGMRDGLAAELQEGIDYELIVRNAQGDMPTLSSLVDAALGDGSDLILTLSTPTLQAAVQRVKSTPIVFSFSSNPLGAGAGTTYEQHLPNVTASDHGGLRAGAPAHPGDRARSAPIGNVGRAVRGQFGLTTWSGCASLRRSAGSSWSASR